MLSDGGGPDRTTPFRLIVLEGNNGVGKSTVAGHLTGWLDAALHFPLAVEAAWIGAGMGLPLGQSLILIGRKR